MRFTKLGTAAAVALSLISLDTHAAPVNRKFHPVVNDDPQNAHLNVQTPGADINQTIAIQQEAGPDGQVIPAPDTKVAACALKGADGDIDLSGGGSCWSPKASAPVAERQAVAASTSVRASSSSPASRTVRVPSLASASVTHAASVTQASVSVARAANAPIPAPYHTRQAVEAAGIPALLPEYRTQNARVSALPRKQLAPAVRAQAATTEFARMQWLLIGAAAALLLLAVGLGILIRMGLGDLLRLRRRTETDEEMRDGQIAVPAVVHDPLTLPRGR